jgi:hypothetical protein
MEDKIVKGIVLKYVGPLTDEQFDKVFPFNSGPFEMQAVKIDGKYHYWIPEELSKRIV